MDSREKKNRLLKMAKKGKMRPLSRTQLGGAFRNYICETSSAYDPDFVNEVQKVRPDWFVNMAEIVRKKKDNLLKMAREGRERPKRGDHPLGNNLVSYSNKKQLCYDEEFTKELKRIRPDWFMTLSDGASEKKDQLIEMAKLGKKRPICKKNTLGAALCSYTSPKNKCYDEEFTKELKRIRPDWFKTLSDGANEKKDQLIEMAKNGEIKPSHTKHPLGKYLYSYTNPMNGNYDEEFTEEIKKIAPHWFKK